MNLGKGRKFEKYDLSSADTDMRIWEITNFKNHVARIQVHIHVFNQKVSWVKHYGGWENMGCNRGVISIFKSIFCQEHLIS
jgi:hypothetical protein